MSEPAIAMPVAHTATGAKTKALPKGTFLA
jgi:hypothetical protein